jgi:hypothetical protein
MFSASTSRCTNLASSVEVEVAVGVAVAVEVEVEVGVEVEVEVEVGVGFDADGDGEQAVRRTTNSARRIVRAYAKRRIGVVARRVSSRVDRG